MHLQFIRLTTEWDQPEIYRLMTDVWVVGDMEGYGRFRDALINMVEAKAAKTLNELYGLDHGMYVLLMPPPADLSEPKIRVIERARFVDEEDKMQMVVRASRAGYRQLADLVQRAMDEGKDDINWHERVNGVSMPGVYVDRPGAVAINLRGPLSVFSRERAEGYDAIVFDRHPHSMPNYVGRYEGEAIDYFNPQRVDELLGLN
ncbi:MAG: hypothetical protein H6818_08865 [Phycisphaerales bacterium]|nr:hypothetical protein [Phycisphaerales bacterium]MCB9862681.1 hypothetical protein [Phycisphaerales bacterium]